LAIVVSLTLVINGLVSVTTAAPATTPRRVQQLHLGARGGGVRSLQSTLSRFSYLPASAVDGVFGTRTWHAVVAFQGWSGLVRDGIVGARTRAALAHAQAPTPWSRATGIEIHVPQQVMLLVANGRVQRAIHVSTGAGGATPIGHFAISRREPMSWSVPFGVWMPLAQYFYGGYALHQYASVPAYPASHGCVRVPAAEAPTVWQFGRTGMRVWTGA
jgi:peptidoglycan hydrolase-like protein with peptidoglycan-binding domain